MPFLKKEVKVATRSFVRGKLSDFPLDPALGCRQAARVGYSLFDIAAAVDEGLGPWQVYESFLSESSARGYNLETWGGANAVKEKIAAVFYKRGKDVVIPHYSNGRRLVTEEFYIRDYVGIGGPGEGKPNRVVFPEGFGDVRGPYYNYDEAKTAGRGTRFHQIIRVEQHSTDELWLREGILHLHYYLAGYTND